MSTQIPLECLEQIFKHLLNYRSTLFNCLLVNRSWCRQVVPLLWSRPFSRLQWKSSLRLIQTYISCMTKDQKSFFTDLDIFIPESSSPLFSYAKYLRKFNYNELSSCVNIWYCDYYQHGDGNIKSDEYIKINLITKELGKFIISHSNLIHELYISKTFGFSQIMDITSFPGAKSSLSHLRKIRITGARYMETKDINDFSNILIGLSQICTQVRDIEIYKFHETSSRIIEGLITLIKSQQNLSKFTVSYWNLNLEPLIFALETQMGLSLHQCDGLDSKIFQTIINSPVGLKKLYLTDNDMSTGTLITLLRNTSGTLNQLTLDERVTISSTSIFETIATHCSSLSHLDIKVLNPNILNLFRPLRQTQLKHLVLNNVSSKGLYDDEVFPEIGKFLPKTLQNLGLIYWDFTLQSLQSFLRNCDCPIKKIFLYKDSGLNDDHLNIITQYARDKGILKSLKFLIRSCGKISIPSQEAIKRAQEVIPLVQGNNRFN
ncbi:8695_t:CDS:2 [Funneliformis mosseae]|uniref:8695_t:CDS:1 n=1 Tax=Funneliformis mosseae TaxID=27381 RepID=A0A9N8WHB0_FUNMO|nr:8695_t:CDS:2 [Funneliformis mosseae]